MIEVLRQDYDRFPKNQTYSLYSETVHFKDPLNEFCGLWRYKLMIRFIETCFLNCKMDLHQIRQADDRILMNWTLSWNTPLPWKPRIAIPGDSELIVAQGLIISHIDHWHCSRLNVLQQHFQSHESH